MVEILPSEEDCEALPAWRTQKLSVGDRIVHPTHGIGTLAGAWDGYLAIDFPGGLVKFRGNAACQLIPLNEVGAWRSVAPSQARQWIQEREAERPQELSKLHRGLRTDFLKTDARCLLERLNEADAVE